MEERVVVKAQIKVTQWDKHGVTLRPQFDKGVAVQEARTAHFNQAPGEASTKKRKVAPGPPKTPAPSVAVSAPARMGNANK